MTITQNPTTDEQYQTMIDNYFACWNATDAQARQAALERTWTVDARSIDPLADVQGHGELAAMFSQFHETYAGHSFVQRGALDAHHGLVRWGWTMLDPHGATALEGIDVAVVDGDGRIVQLAGFFGADVPAGD